MLSSYPLFTSEARQNYWEWHNKNAMSSVTETVGENGIRKYYFEVQM